MKKKDIFDFEQYVWGSYLTQDIALKYVIEGDSDFDNMGILQKVAFRIREIKEDNKFNDVIFQKSTAKIMG